MWLQPNAKTFQDFLKVNIDYKSPCLSNIFKNIKGPAKSNHEELCENQRTLKIKFICFQNTTLVFILFLTLLIFLSFFFSFFHFFEYIWTCLCVCMCVHVYDYAHMSVWKALAGFPLTLGHPPVSAQQALGLQGCSTTLLCLWILAIELRSSCL